MHSLVVPTGWRIFHLFVFGQTVGKISFSTLCLDELRNHQSRPLPLEFRLLLLLDQPSCRTASVILSTRMLSYTVAELHTPHHLETLCLRHWQAEIVGLKDHAKLGGCSIVSMFYFLYMVVTGNIHRVCTLKVVWYVITALLCGDWGPLQIPNWRNMPDFASVNMRYNVSKF